MSLDKKQIYKVKKALFEIGLDYKDLIYDMLDHVCCLIELKIEQGDSFDKAFEKTFSDLSPNQIRNIQSSTLRLINMEKSFSFKTSALSTLPFALIGLMWMSGDFLKQAPIVVYQFFFWSSFLSMFFLLGIGWTKEFPRWSIPSIGFCLTISLLFINVTSVPLIPIKDLGLWALLPVVLTLIISLTINPSLKPLISFYKKVVDDKSILLFTGIGFIPWAAYITFDGMHKSSALPYVLIINLVIIISVFLYLNSSKKLIRNISILTGFIVPIIFSILYTNSYWN